jgi:hypothetical protein
MAPAKGPRVELVHPGIDLRERSCPRRRGRNPSGKERPVLPTVFGGALAPCPGCRVPIRDLTRLCFSRRGHSRIRVLFSPSRSVSLGRAGKAWQARLTLGELWLQRRSVGRASNQLRPSRFSPTSEMSPSPRLTAAALAGLLTGYQGVGAGRGRFGEEGKQPVSALGRVHHSDERPSCPLCYPYYQLVGRETY